MIDEMRDYARTYFKKIDIPREDVKNKYLNVLITMLNKRIQPEKYQNMKAEFFLNSMGFGVKITTLKVLCEQAIVFEKRYYKFLLNGVIL